jgi:hypothetical protein
VELADRGAARGISVVCTFSWNVVPPSNQTLSKISPMTWKLVTRFGPPLPTYRRTFSPTFAFSALSPVSAPSAPLNST